EVLPRGGGVPGRELPGEVLRAGDGCALPRERVVVEVREARTAGAEHGALEALDAVRLVLDSLAVVAHRPGGALVLAAGRIGDPSVRLRRGARRDQEDGEGQ